MIVINCYICIAANEKICNRCSKHFRVNLDGQYANQEVCFYHQGKTLKEFNGTIMSLYMHMLNIKEVGIKRLSLYLCLPWICFRCWIRWKDVLFTLWGRFQKRRMHSCWGKRGNWCTCVCSINYLFGFFCCPCLWFISFILIDTQYHVHVSNKWENLTGYLQTLPGPPVPDGDYGVYAMDTEMVDLALVTSI